jgi:hypothetical protein
MSLLELQRRMAVSVMRPLTPDFRMQTTTADGEPMQSEADTFIKPNDRLTSFERLEIYNRQYWFRIVGALSEDFPALCRVLGDKQFDAMILAYLAENPSTSFSLRNLGSNLVAWLGSNPDWTGARHQLSIDVARLEWAYVEAFDNAQEAALTTDDLKHLHAESILSLQPHLRLLDLQYPVDDFVLRVHRRKPASDIASNAVVKDGASHRNRRMSSIAVNPIHLAVHRFDESVYYKRIDYEAFLLLRSIEQREPLGYALEAAFAESSATQEEQAAQIRAWFANWSELGWFCKG